MWTTSCLRSAAELLLHRGIIEHDPGFDDLAADNPL
jgi:hypothetical protein